MVRVGHSRENDGIQVSGKEMVTDQKKKKKEHDKHMQIVKRGYT